MNLTLKTYTLQLVATGRWIHVKYYWANAYETRHWITSIWTEKWINTKYMEMQTVNPQSWNHSANDWGQNND